MARRSGTNENSVGRACQELLRLRGLALAFRVNSGTLRNATGRPVSFIFGPDGEPFRGFSDRLVCLPPLGRWLAVETKRPAIPALGQRAGRPTKHQLLFLGAVNDAGGVGILVDDVRTLERVLDALRADPTARFNIDGSPLG
jgi:hypothetical protein